VLIEPDAQHYIRMFAARQSIDWVLVGVLFLREALFDRYAMRCDCTPLKYGAMNP